MSAPLTIPEALAVLSTGRAAEVLPDLERLAGENPSNFDVHKGLALCYHALGRLDDAINTYAAALALLPGDAELLNHMGAAYRAAGDNRSALRAFQGAALSRPDWHVPLASLCILFRDVGELDRAERCIQRAMGLKPDDAELHNVLGALRERQGLIPEALAAYRRSLELNPANAKAHSNFLYISHFDERATPASLIAEHAEFQQRHADPLAAAIRRPAPEPLEGRRLRVGYVSPDFRYHPVGQFMLPVLRAHDRSRFEVFCYASLARAADAVTGQFRQTAEHWRDIAPLSDDDAAELIRNDRIDVLVDLTMHMAGNRALLLARKPARTQLCYLAYCSTTGLSAMDYRVSDPHFDPPDTEDDYVERTLKLPRTYWCYEPRMEAPVGPLPADANGFVTFGNLNNVNKLSPTAVSTYLAILNGLPSARLILHAGEGEPRQRIHALAAEAGLDPARIDFMGYEPPQNYYATYNRIDIALDPFPYAGGTTSCDALYTGVPLITLAGRTPVGRGGVSLLRNLGLDDLIALSREQYIQKATQLAGDLPRLRALRSTLRERMKASPMMDTAGFTRDWERLLLRAAR